MLCFLFGAQLLYALAGHTLIHAAHRSTSVPLIDSLMAGRATTPVQLYLWSADDLMFGIITNGALATTFGLALLSFLISNPRGVAAAGVIGLVFSFGVFCLLEVFPSWTMTIGLDKNPYHRNRLLRISDETLGFRGKPFLHLTIANYRSHAYEVTHGLNAPTTSVDWKTGKNGFRGETSSEQSEIVVVGDSFIEYGTSEADMFGHRLQTRLTGIKVANFGMSGYGPAQYLEVFRAYALKQTPQVAFFCFYAGNDIDGLRAYLRWKNERKSLGAYTIGYESFLKRYPVAMREVGRFLYGGLTDTAESLARSIAIGPGYSHPDVATVKLPDADAYKVLIVDKAPATSVEDMLLMDDWKELARVLREFRNISTAHAIKPVILYIPMASSIYAEYTTEESGTNWLKVRDQQVLSAKNSETAVRFLSESLKIDVVNLGDAFRQAARNGKMLYESVDTHWNSEGREIAAEFVTSWLEVSDVFANLTSSRGF